MFSIAVVNEDRACVDMISEYIYNTKQYEELEVYRFLTVEKLIEVSQEKSFCLIFLDVLCHGKDCIDVIHQYFRHIPVVYMTSHVERMNEAFDKNVYKFVLQEHIDDFFKKSFNQLLFDIKEPRVVVQTKKDIHFIDIQDIIYIQYEKRNLYIYTKKDKYLLKRRSLKSFIEKYQYTFLEVNRDIYVNFHYISTIQTEKGILLANQQYIYVTPYRYQTLIKEYTEMKLKKNNL